MENTNDVQDIAKQLGHISPPPAPDHPPVPLVAPNAPKYSIEVLVPNRPGYIGGSGPPLAKLQTQPPYNKSSFTIIDNVEEEIDKIGRTYYVVAATGNPESRVIVPPEDILKWVSQRALEDFSYREYQRFDMHNQVVERRREEAVEEELRRKQEKKALKARRGNVEDSWDDEGNPIALKSTSKRSRGRPKKRQESMEIDDEALYHEVVPAKKDRTLDSFRNPSEPQLASPPSLSQPSLSQPMPSLKRKISTLFTRDSTPGDSTDDLQDELVEAIKIRNNKKHNPAPASTPSPLPQAQKQSSMRPPESATGKILGTPKQLFPIFGGRNKAVAYSEPPRSTSHTKPPARKRPGLPAISRSFEQ